MRWLSLGPTSPPNITAVEGETSHSAWPGSLTLPAAPDYLTHHIPLSQASAKNALSHSSTEDSGRSQDVLFALHMQAPAESRRASYQIRSRPGPPPLFAKTPGQATSLCGACRGAHPRACLDRRQQPQLQLIVLTSTASPNPHPHSSPPATTNIRHFPIASYY